MQKSKSKIIAHFYFLLPSAIIAFLADFERRNKNLEINMAMQKYDRMVNKFLAIWVSW